MGDLVNLNKARKQRERVKAKAQAAENRIRFGQDKGTREQARREAERIRQELDGRKLD
jgi:hypothetical protein